jgi:hypothetical protein
MASGTTILIRHHGLRRISAGEALESLGGLDLTHGLPQDEEVDTEQFETAIEGGSWETSHLYVWDRAKEIRAVINSASNPRIVYFGAMPEIPHAIALGAYIGAEWTVELFQYDSVSGKWTLPHTDNAHKIDTLGLPSDSSNGIGHAIIRVEISSSIEDDEVWNLVGKSDVADVRIRPADRTPEVGALIRSVEDVTAVRNAFREAIARILETRPGTNLIQLFVAAPPAVCFSIGQELRLRNIPPVQTYRYRNRAGAPVRSIAILLEDRAPDFVDELTAADVERADVLRTGIWPEILGDIVDYSRQLRSRQMGLPQWFDGLHPFAELDRVSPYPELPPLRTLVADRDKVSSVPRPRDYGFNKDTREWELSDGLVVGFEKAVNGDQEKLKQLIRLFFFHEYLHDWQDLTKYTAEDVGSFANSLERIDYIADSYALIHQYDFMTREGAEADSAHQRINLYADQIDLAIRSFWAFDPIQQTLWQERRIRRYLNWFWRRVQIRRAPELADLLTVIVLLGRPPVIEIAGLEYQTDTRRIRLNLRRVRPREQLQVGMVLEDGRFYRSATAGNMSLEALISAFISKDHEQVALFFNGLFENVRGKSGAYPSDAT